MEILAVLIPLSFALLGLAGTLFVWAVNNDQFDQLDRHGFDILERDEKRPLNKNGPIEKKR